MRKITRISKRSKRVYGTGALYKQQLAQGISEDDAKKQAPLF